MKTNSIQVKSPVKLLPEMQKMNIIFQILLGFKTFFEKAVVLENGQIWNQSIILIEKFRRASPLRFTKNEGIVDGRGKHQMGATLIHYTSIFHEFQWGIPPESFIQKYWLVSNLPIFQNYRFFEKGPKNQKILKNSKFFFAFLVAIL